jgi:hypothetical protein
MTTKQAIRAARLEARFARIPWPWRNGRPRQPSGGRVGQLHLGALDVGLLEAVAAAVPAHSATAR